MVIENNFLKGKKGIIMGLANQKSIAWGVAQACKNSGAELCFSYPNETMLKRVQPLAQELGYDFILPCDVTDEAEIEKLFKDIEAKWGKIDFIIHSVAFSDKNELRGKFYNTTKDNFLNTMDISCYSFMATAKYGQKILNEGGSIITMSYLGAERYVPHYNVMGVAKAALEASVRYLAADLGPRGIRVNAISAGPLKTLASSGIGDMRKILDWNENHSPLKRNITIEDVGGSALSLLSDLGSGVTGEVYHVDAGYHIIGMQMLEEEDEQTP